MKRHPALQDLSRDHFHVLFRCQRFRKLLGQGTPWETLRAFVDEFLVFFESDMSPHFREEDEIVVPWAERQGDAALRRLAEAIREEHVELRQAINDLRATLASMETTREKLARLESWVTRHVKQEEEQLFEGIQETLSEEQLREVGLQSRSFRRRFRSPDAIGPRAGRG